ncbi:MAG: poly(A) polymerase [Alphaproteobacteria bacterium]|jgi:tRNA nucleotidyltransferase/poly(A) polymerase|nr:poly(A) polymerase [Alphaproteobacteria bacterium]
MSMPAAAEPGRTDRSLAQAEWLTTGSVARLLAVLASEGEEARVVGGAVRNALLNEKIAEIDIATTAVPEEVIRRVTAAGFKAVPTGIDHGTVTVVIQGQPFEVTTLRVDVETFGRKANVRFGRDWKVDAERRDFTMNALSASADGTVYDYVGGLTDLVARRVRFIGDPGRRIAEDYLRILRFFRFHAAYGQGALDVDGLNACIAGRGGLEKLSRERIRMELLKLVVARGAQPALAAMTDAGLLVSLLAGVPLLTNFARMTQIEAALDLPPDAIRGLAALEVSVVEDAERLWQRLRLANAEHERLVSMADGWWGIEPADEESAARVLLYRLGQARFLDRVLLAWARSGTAADDAQWREFVTLPDRWTAPVFPLKAADFIQRGIEKGPALGEALRAAEQAWMAAGFPENAKTLARITDVAVATSKPS